MNPSPSPAKLNKPEDTAAQLRGELAAVRAELRELQHSHQRNLSALCAIADGVAIVDTDGRVTCLNTVATHLTGWKEHEALGRRLSGVIKFNDHQGQALDVLSDGFSGDHEAIVSMVRKDGHAILVDGTVAEIHDADRNVVGSVVTFRNVTAATRMMRMLSFQANHDPLTGLHNRRAFTSKLQRAINHAAEFGSGNALLYIDLDQFKSVNDRGGHFAGDELLRQLAVLLRKQLREHDTVARLGGDEFAVLLENCTPEDAATVAEKIRSAVVGFRFTWDGDTFRVGASIGQIDFADGAWSTEELVGFADQMCYVAKCSGRGRVVNYRAQGPDQARTGEDVSHRPGARRDEGG